jgi:hypothetical protein
VSPRYAVDRGFFIGIDVKKFSNGDAMRMNLKAAIDVRFGSQIAFARAVSLHPVKINRLCNGWIEPTPIERVRIAATLKADAEWLFSTVTRIPAPGNSSVSDEKAAGAHS